MINPKFFIDEWIFSLSLVAFTITELLNPRIPNYSKSDFKVLFSLFVMLIILKGLSDSNFLKSLACRIKSGNFVGHKLIIFSALTSIFLTNDVAVLIVVPITLFMKIKNIERLIVLEIAAANAGSSLSPFGNPQNLFIYYHFNLNYWKFIKEIFPLSLFISILILTLTPKLHFNEKSVFWKYSKETYLLFVFFCLFVLSVLKLIPLWFNIVTPLYALFKNRKLLKIDYPLLLTFFLFFGFTDNLTHLLNVKLNSPEKVFLYSALGSQIMSNVPAALFFGDLTDNWKALLWGVNVGGFGTLVSSLANLIGYKLYSEKLKQKGKFLFEFHLLNALFFFTGIFLFFLKFFF